MRSRCALVRLAACVLLSGLVAPAVGQLSSADIAALQERGEAEGWTFTVRENPATQYPLEQLCGAVEPPDWRSRAQFDPCPPRRDLPEKFTFWRLAALNPVRDQGPCGSCWAFAAVGTMEHAIHLRTTWTVDLAEQWLVSCTGAGSCSGGWHTDSFEYLRQNGWQDPCGGSGAVLESGFPYVAADVPCGCPYSHPYSLDYWAVVGPQWGVPTVAQIKQAIYDHGPVAVCVYVNNAFQAYHEGVFNACEDKWINHVVVLYGWDDTQGSNGVWYMRNSWGQGWGESGNMRIEYGCCQIGYATCYVESNWADCNSNGIHDRIDILLKRSEDANHNRIPDECEVRPGDLNCDGVVDFADINPFIVALNGRETYQAQFPLCLWRNADMNGDGTVSYADINPFVATIAR